MTKQAKIQSLKTRINQIGNMPKSQIANFLNTTSAGTTDLGHALSDFVNGRESETWITDAEIETLSKDFRRILKSAKTILATRITVETDSIKTLTADEIEILVAAGIFQRMRECGFDSIGAGYSKFWESTNEIIARRGEQVWA